jgi:hypothetical protein
MRTFRYGILDFLTCFTHALVPAHLILGALLALAGLGAWQITCATGIPQSTTGHATDILTPFAVTPLNLSPAASWAVALVALVALWLTLCLIQLTLARASALRHARVRRPHTLPALRFALAHLGSAAALPLTALIVSAPFWVPAALWALLFLIPGAGFWIAVVTSPLAAIPVIAIAAVALCFFLTLFIQIAAVAVHGPGSYEALSRGMVYGARAPLWYAVFVGFRFCILAPLTVGMAKLAWLLDGWLGIAPSGPAALVVFALCMALPVSYWCAAYCTLFLLLRHRVDAVPAWHLYDPKFAFEHKATVQERAEALRAVSAPSPSASPQLPASTTGVAP